MLDSRFKISTYVYNEELERVFMKFWLSTILREILNGDFYIFYRKTISINQ